MSNRICTFSVTIDGIPYHYEAHTFQRCAEILANTMRILDTGSVDEFGAPIYKGRVDSFTVHYFSEV